jgi:hypothetical protein
VERVVGKEQINGGPLPIEAYLIPGDRLPFQRRRCRDTERRQQQENAGDVANREEYVDVDIECPSGFARVPQGNSAAEGVRDAGVR